MFATDNETRVYDTDDGEAENMFHRSWHTSWLTLWRTSFSGLRHVRRLDFMDVLTPQQRSYNMSRIRGRNTSPELVLRKALFNRGLRYRLHRKDLPGTPDLVFPRFRTAIFVHGCFWHGHKCHLFKVPGTRTEFWMKKISGNIKRDSDAIAALQNRGWRILVIWECALKGKRRLIFERVLTTTESFLMGNRRLLQLKGR
jgi:DNA mismatch endonuclease (patch repair protein)